MLSPKLYNEIMEKRRLALGTPNLDYNILIALPMRPCQKVSWKKASPS